MTESEKRSHRVCFTGHRPEKLTRSEMLIKKELEIQIRQAIKDELMFLLQEWQEELIFGRHRLF